MQLAVAITMLTHVLLGCPKPGNISDPVPAPGGMMPTLSYPLILGCPIVRLLTLSSICI